MKINMMCCLQMTKKMDKEFTLINMIDCLKMKKEIEKVFLLIQMEINMMHCLKKVDLLNEKYSL